MFQDFVKDFSRDKSWRRQDDSVFAVEATNDPSCDSSAMKWRYSREVSLYLVIQCSPDDWPTIEVGDFALVLCDGERLLRPHHGCQIGRVHHQTWVILCFLEGTSVGVMVALYAIVQQIVQLRHT